MISQRLGADFYRRDALIVAPGLLGKVLVRRFDNGKEFRSMIAEVEAYCGEEDLACHASHGRTQRTEVMYHEGGKIYVYLVYGMYWMLNFVTGKEGHPQAVLIRGLEDISGPGRITKQLQIDRTYYGEDLNKSKRLWIEDAENIKNYHKTARIGVNYAGEYKDKLWRFLLFEPGVKGIG